MAIGKKLSIDLSDTNKLKLEKIKQEDRISYGNTINSLIEAFCDMPTDINEKFLCLCKTEVRTLYDQLESAGAFEKAELSQKIQSYMNIMTFLNHGMEIDINQIKRKPAMRTVSVKNGIVICPSDWIIVNPDRASEYEYAGVVECRNSDRYGIPHFLFFSKHKYAREYEKYELAGIERLCALASPQFAEAQKHQVQIVEDPEHPGTYLNFDKFLEAPTIGHFALYEEGDPLYEPDYAPPCGAKIVRK